MQFERLYHNAVSTAEGPFETERGASSHSSALTLLQNAFPQALEASAYALRKRLICPRWWLIGVMSQWMVKDFETLTKRLGLNEDDFVFAGPTINAKNFPLVAALWTELLAQVSINCFESPTVELNLRRILRGTSAEIFEQREFLTHYLSSALRIQKVKFIVPRPSRSRTKTFQQKKPQLALESVGLVQIFENVILSESDSQRLSITFAKCPRKLFSNSLFELLPVALRSKPESHQVEQYSSAFVTLQPDVLQAMSRSASPKKLVPYLSLEITKSQQGGAPSQTECELSAGVWRGRSVLSQELTRLHKDELSQSRSLYDHGLLSWENEAPRQRIRALKRESVGESGNASGIVHCWRLSQHVIDAISFEQALTKHLSSSELVTNQIATQSQTKALLAQGESDYSPRVERAQEFSSYPSDSPEAGSQKIVASTITSHEDAESTIFKASSSSEVAAQKHTALYVKAKPSVSKVASHQSIDMCLSEKSTSHHQPQKRVIAYTSQRELQSKDVWSDDEFLMCVAEFYESLTPLQQQAFERERRRMSPEQFKVYVTPALKRFKLSNA